MPLSYKDSVTLTKQEFMQGHLAEIMGLEAGG